ESKPEGIAWAVTICAVFFVWPTFNLNAPRNIFYIANGDVRIGAVIRNIYAPRKLESSKLAALASSDSSDRNVAMLTFPFDEVGAGINHRLFAPILEIYGAGTPSLERYYLHALENKRTANLAILYGLDDAKTGGAQAITRTPRIFEYIYRHFELTD